MVQSSPITGDRPPIIAAWGAGANSTAMIIELCARGTPPDMVLKARMPEKPDTEKIIPLFQRWMDDHRIPYQDVSYQPRRFKHWPPYSDLLENCLTNGTLPSIAFGRSSCSLKWKVAPQDAWTRNWEPARQAWNRGQKVIRLIGYDCSRRDSERYAEHEGQVSPLFDYRYPLREWNWDREACDNRIAEAGLPPFPKSSCFFCTAMQPDEVRSLGRRELRLIVLMEARAAPRLKSCKGLWRSTTKGTRGREARPGSMTSFIRDEKLLDRQEIASIIRTAPTELKRFQDHAGQISIDQRPHLAEWLDRFVAR